MIDKNKIYNQDCLVGMLELQDESVDLVLTDPPYKYLTNQKLEVDFDEDELFEQVKRVLKPDGFVVLFGRGTSFYRWNTILADLGFRFKEEIIWDKRNTSSPLLPIGRCHETISIHTKGKGVINNVRIPYLEMKGHDIDAIVSDIKRLQAVLGNEKSLRAVQTYLETNHLKSDERISSKYNATVSSPIMAQDRSGTVAKQIKEGAKEKSIVRIYDGINASRHKTTRPKSMKSEDRCVIVSRQVKEGARVKSIISETRDHYATVHPTQKPVRLLERLMMLTGKEGDLVLDPFSGSASTALACINQGRDFIGFEIDKEYWESGNARVKAAMIERQGMLQFR